MKNNRLTRWLSMRTLEQFKELHTDDVRGIASLTIEEYQYASQVAIWSACGQLSVPGTSFTAGRAALVEPASDATKIRIFDSVVAILKNAAHWTKNLYTGMSLRAEEDKDVRGVEVLNELGLEGAAADASDGIKKETINGKEYYTRVMYVASATSAWIDGYTTKVYSTDAPSGTIFTSENGSSLETVQENGAAYYVVDTNKNRFVSERVSTLDESQVKSIAHGQRGYEFTIDGANTIIDEWITTAGGINAAAEDVTGNGQTVSLEQILAWNPDVIISSTPGEADSILNDPDWASITAVKNGEVYCNPEGIFLWDRYGVEETLQFQGCAQLLYPELFEDFDIRQEVKDFYTNFLSYELTNDEVMLILNHDHPVLG